METMHGTNVLHYLYRLATAGIDVEAIRVKKDWNFIQDELEILESYLNGERKYKVVY